ncbi:hypothetical protein [Streptomyces sp. NPDC048650]|uniref:hypothetical protein n=1 Tax=Streptomyces sp. NPDC048650 TaxID=3365583 RepID=UPI003713F577
MDDITDPIERAAGLRAGADTPATGADPDAALRECAARLAADPGGRHAPLWVYALTGAAEHLTGRPGPAADVAQCAVDALLACHRALREASCAHGSHPWQRDLAAMWDDEIWDQSPDVRLLANGKPEGEDDAWTQEDAKDLYLCPVGTAGYARITADIIAPGSAPVIDPEGEDEDDFADTLSRGHETSIGFLSSTLNDYPTGDPGDDLRAAAAVPDHLAKGGLAGHVVTLHACIWYAVSGRVQEQSVLDEMVKGLTAVLPELPDLPCAHQGGEHPDLRAAPDQPAADGISLRSPGGRAALQQDHAEGCGPALDAWTCPASCGMRPTRR